MPNSGIIFSRSTAGMSATECAQIGRLDTPIRMIIEHESDLLTKKDQYKNVLCSVEKSNGFGETSVIMDEFGDFQAVAEGAEPELDSFGEVGDKFVQHVTFSKEFVITAEMIDDAKNGICTKARKAAQYFMRSYYRTQNGLVEMAFVNGTEKSIVYNKTKVDLTTADGKPLFSGTHLVGREGDTQSNYYYNARSSGEAIDSAYIESVLSNLAVKGRNMLDENGNPMGYVPTRIVIPGNRPGLEKCIRKAIGSRLSPGKETNDINTQYELYNLTVLPRWVTTKDVFQVISDECNKNIGASVFYNRKGLKINAEKDRRDNQIYTGFGRYSIVHNTYKHAMMFESVANGSTVNGATALTLE